MPRAALAPFGTVAIAVLLAGCAGSPESRIADDQAAFDAWPEHVQAKVRAGAIDLGMTEEQVRVALGDPDEKSTSIDANGETITWAWTSSRPGVGVSLGGIGIGGVGFGGVGIGTGSKKTAERTVEFRDGRVVRARVFE